MEKYSDIIQFSRDLFVHSCEDIPFPFEYEIVLKPPRSIQAAATTLQFFRDAFCTNFEKVYKKSLSEVADTDEQFFRYVIPRCLKLVDDDNYYFSFMLVAAFIWEIMHQFMLYRDCYRFTSVAYKCLAAVYKRRLEENFEKNGGWKGLRAFCKKMSTTEKSSFRTYTDFLTGGDRSYKKQVYQRIKQCDILQCEKFMLTDYELVLIKIDDHLATQAELSSPITMPFDSPLKVEWTMVKDNQRVKVCSRFDDESGVVISTVVPDSDAEPSVVWDTDVELYTTQSSNTRPPVVQDSVSKLPPEDSSDNESLSDSNDEPDCEVSPVDEITTGHFARTVLQHLNPEEFDRRKSARTCKWCKKRCFQWSKYMFIRHGLLSMKPERFRKTKFILTSSLKAVGKILSKFL